MSATVMVTRSASHGSKYQKVSSFTAELCRTSRQLKHQFEVAAVVAELAAHVGRVAGGPGEDKGALEDGEHQVGQRVRVDAGNRPGGERLRHLVAQPFAPQLDVSPDDLVGLPAVGHLLVDERDEQAPGLGEHFV